MLRLRRQAGNNPQMVTMGHFRRGGAERMVVGSGLCTAFPTVTEDMMAEHDFLTTGEVAVMFRVNPKTVTRWARSGRISAVRTIGGHRRFRASEIERFLDNATDLPAEGMPPRI